METHDAPLAVLTSALSSGQSAIASDPSRMALGLPVGRRDRAAVEVVAPDDDGRVNRPSATISLNRSPAGRVRRSPSQQMRAGSPWNATRSPARRIQRASDSFSGKRSRMARSVAAMSAGSPDSAAQRNGPLALAEQRADVRRHEPGNANGPLVAGELGLAPDRVAVVEHLGPGVEEADHRLDVLGHRGRGAVGELLRLLGRVVGRVLDRDALRYVGSGSWAEVWSVTMSMGTPRRSSSGPGWPRCRRRRRRARGARPSRVRRTRPPRPGRPPPRRGSGSARAGRSRPRRHR
jgi:hypothetical protein